jgi:hypothetical protein
MSVFAFIWCQANQHVPHRRDVEWDGIGYVGTCRHCNTPIYRHKHRDWRRRIEGWEALRESTRA